MMGGGEVPYEEQYLTFEALEAGTFTLTIPSGLSTTQLRSVSYSLDNGETWTTTNNVANTEVVITTPTIQRGGKVLWRGNGEKMGVNTSTYSAFSSSGTFNVYGNLASLLNNTKPSGIISLGSRTDYVFNELFISNVNIISAENLIFPSSTGLGAYRNMFDGCVNLIQAPTILHPIDTFQSCYESMFKNCANIERAPELHAATISARSYYAMFQNCSKLKYVKCLATSLSSNSPTLGWLLGVAATGTFVKDATMNDWPSNSNGIPSGWTVIDA